MLNFNKIKHLYDCGVISYQLYLEKSKRKPNKKYDYIKSIIVFIFPYPKDFYNSKKYQTAKFAYGMDYHIYVKEKIAEAAKLLGLTNNFEIMADVSFLHEKLCAAMAGLGVIGKNSLLLTKKYGSRVVIGEIITDQEFEEYDQEATYSFCDNCDKCINRCPTNALIEGFNRNRCLSHLNQSKSKEFELYDEMKKISYGCDICQDVCPANKVNFNYPSEFDFNKDSSFTLKEFLKLDEDTYQSKYVKKTFNWIGYLKMLRNLLVLSVNNHEITIDELTEIQHKYKDTDWFYDHLEYLKNKLDKDE